MFKFNFKNKKTKETIEEQSIKKIEIPKGWYVSEAGQNPLHMLWFVFVVNFEDLSNKEETPRYFFEEDCDSFEEALSKCIDKINLQN